MDTRSYDINIENSCENIPDAWEKWESRPNINSKIRLGLLGEILDHPEFLEILQRLKPAEYFTSGRIFGTKGDPRRIRYLDETIKSGSKIILRWSDTPFCKRAFQELKSSKIPFIVKMDVKEKEDLAKFLWDPEVKYLLTPELDINQLPRVSLTSDDLKDRKNTEIMEYYQNILLTNHKIIITKDTINLKPLMVYDRI